MNQKSTHYLSGEKIRPGDRISLAGKTGTVLFVIGLPGVPTEWVASSEWLGEQNAEGFMLDVEGMGLVLMQERHEDLVFFGRKK
ncbi:MAG: hypothetical protein U0798_14130 [Gemmataceae bacterium]